jgi:competence protein ComEA
MFETSLLFSDSSEEKKLSPPFWSAHKIRFLMVGILILSGVACTAWGTWLFFTPTQVPSLIVDEPLLTLEPDKVSQLYIDVSGAVEQPGIYTVNDGERVAAAISAAGGLSFRADQEYVHSTLNLSARLKDEQKIYIPFEGERPATALIDEPSSNSPMSQTTNDNDLVSINTATESQLDELPKIGPVTAEKLINSRPYSAIEELVSRKIISQSVFDEIKALIKL